MFNKRRHANDFHYGEISPLTGTCHVLAYKYYIVKKLDNYLSLADELFHFNVVNVDVNMMCVKYRT